MVALTSTTPPTKLPAIGLSITITGPALSTMNDFEPRPTVPLLLIACANKSCCPSSAGVKEAKVITPWTRNGIAPATWVSVTSPSMRIPAFTLVMSVIG